jgi:DNA-binding GntR family transcriptional regulator
VLSESVAGQPLYRQISASLQGAIADGQYPVGTLLPTEIEISQQFGVCRQTVRDALRILSDAGLVRRRRRVGTVVTGHSAEASFVQPLRGFEELLQYARNARLSVDQYGPAGNSRLARQLKLSPADWLRVQGLRGSPAHPVGLTTALIRRDCAPTREALEKRSRSFSEVIEHMSGIAATRIEQEITARALTKPQAELLSATPGAAALQMLRRYFDQKDALYFVAESIHPADRFAYTMSFNRRGNAEDTQPKRRSSTELF